MKVNNISTIGILLLALGCGQSKTDTQEISLSSEEIEEIELVDSLAYEIDSVSKELMKDAEESDKKIDVLLEDI